MTQTYETTDWNMNSATQVTAPIPGTEGMAVVSVDLTALFTGAMNCYQNIAIEGERQRTERMRIREYARICIQKIEGDSRLMEMALCKEHEKRMLMISEAFQLLGNPEVDEYTRRTCAMVINHSMESSLLEQVTKPLALSNPVMSLIGNPNQAW